MRSTVKDVIQDKIPLVTSLTAGSPGIPNPIPDGFEVHFLADPGGIVWRLRYRPASSSAYKWELVGGSELGVYLGGESIPTSANYGDLPTVQRLLAPLAGEYRCRFGAQSYNATASTYSFEGLHVNNVLQVEAASFVVAVNGQVPLASEWLITVAKSDDIRLKFKTSGGTAFFLNRYLIVRPSRVG